MNKGYLYMVATAICWSFIGVFVRFNGQSALMISCITSIVGLLSCLFLTRPKIVLNPTVCLAAIAQFMTGLTFIYANQLTSVGNAIVLQYTSMIFVLVYQCIDQRKRPQPKQLLVICMAIIGMILFFFDELSMQGMIGNILAIVSGAFFGIQFYLNTKEKAVPMSSTVIAFAISSCLIVFLVPQLVEVKMMEWGIMVISGFLCYGISGLFFAKGIRKVHPLTANIICMSEVIMAPLWTYILFHETLGIRSLIGATILIGAIVLNMFWDYLETQKKEKYLIHIINKRYE